MLMPILCFTCGCPLADKEDLFNYFKNEKINKNVNTDSIITSIDCMDIFEKLDIPNDCCRMHMISNMQFTDYY